MERRKFLKIMGAAGVMGALPLKFSLRGVGPESSLGRGQQPGTDEIQIKCCPRCPFCPRRLASR